MAVEGLHRRPKPCKQCRHRHRACYDESPNASRLSPCVACKRQNVVCELLDNEGPSNARKAAAAASAGKEINIAAELRTQAAKLASLIKSWNEDDVYESVKGPGPRHDDLVEKLTELCFADKTTHSYTNPLLMDAYAALGSDGAFNMAAAGTAGFCFAEASEKTMDQLLAELPGWSEVEPILIGWQTSWIMRIDGLFLPTWARAIQDLYDNHFMPQPHPHQLAELFAFLALSQAGMACATSATSPGQSKVHQAKVDRFVSLAFQALTVSSDHFEVEPTLQCVRTLETVAVTYIGAWPDDSRMARGAAVLPYAGQMALQLGWQRRDTEFPDETVPQRFERKMLVQALGRMIWMADPYTKSPKCLTGQLLLVEAPDLLDLDELPKDPKYAGWLPSQTTFDSLQVQSQCALFGARVHRMFFHDKPQHYLARMHEISTELHHMEAMLPASWRHYEDCRGNLVVPPAADLDERVARFFGLPIFHYQYIVLHRRFIMSNASTAEWHRAEVLMATRKQWAVLPEARSVVGGFVSRFCSMWDGLTLSALLLAPRHAQHLTTVERIHCENVIKYSLDRFTEDRRSEAVVRLSRILTFILERSRAVSLQPPKTAKRAKGKDGGRISVAPSHEDESVEDSLTGSGGEGSYAFTFDSPSPVSFSASPPVIIEDGELKHFEPPSRPLTPANTPWV